MNEKAPSIKVGPFFIYYFCADTLKRCGMGATEIVIIFLIYLLLFGAKGIPSLAKSLGEGVRHFKSATDEIQREILDTKNDIKTDFRDIKKQASSVADKAQEE